VPHLSRRVTGGGFEFGPFDGANTLVHDGENRATSANCGSNWSQTFSFDAFGNINKSGNRSFSASYSPATNRLTSIGSSTPTYDADGNVTNDFLHTYAWDGYGRPVTIDTVGVTYDAVGRGELRTVHAPRQVHNHARGDSDAYR
jgi:YD repeat-containing protein